MSSSFDSPPGMGALFDLSFTRFLTVSVIKVIYILGIVLLALGWLIFVIGGFSQGFMYGVLGIIFGTILALIELLFLRVWLELIVVIFRIGENTSAMARATGVSADGRVPRAADAAAAANVKLFRPEGRCLTRVDMSARQTKEGSEEVDLPSPLNCIGFFVIRLYSADWRPDAGIAGISARGWAAS